MHSDYFSPMKPRIRVFLDRIEFLNPGSLPKDIESIIKEDFTMPRNPIIAKIFRVIKLSENAGSGFDKMFSGWKSYYETEPEVSSDIDHYKITFPLEKDIIPEKVSEKMSEKTSEKIIETGEKAREKTREKTLQEVQKYQYITIAELSEIIGVTPRSIERNIQKLQADGMLQRVGPDKGGYWEVVEK